MKGSYTGVGGGVAYSEGSLFVFSPGQYSTALLNEV